MVSLLVAVIAVYVSPLSLRELRHWAVQVRADILTNIVQPGRFATLGGNLTFHIADRRPNGLLVGIFLDDRRNPNEHATFLAEQGEILKNDSGSFLVLEKGSVQRLETGQSDPRIVTFDRYAFDLSKFGGGPQNIVYNTHEKYMWDLLWPQPDDPLFVAQPGEYRSELHDRFATPLYPFAFVILAYMFLGPPQTTRQSRTLAALGLIGAVAVLRLIGFLSVIVGVHIPGILALQYLALVRRRRRRGMADFPRPGDRTGGRRVANSRPPSLNVSHARRRVEERRCWPERFHAISGFGFSGPSSARFSAWSRSPP